METNPQKDSMKTMNILAVVAHPADSFDIIGGTLANHVESGDNVVLTVMHGSDTLNLFNLADEMKAGEVQTNKVEQATQAHMQNVKNACDILGLEDIRFLTYEGEMLTHSPSLVSKVADLIQQVQPHIVITHHPLEDGGASEYAVCGKCLVEALYLAEGARSSGAAPHHVSQVYFMCWPGITTSLDAASVNRYGSIYIDVTHQIEKKVRAYALLHEHYMNMHKAAKIIEGTCGTPGIHSRVPYVEVFQPYRPEVYRTLPVSDHNLGLTEKSWKQVLGSLRLVAPYIDGV